MCQKPLPSDFSGLPGWAKGESGNYVIYTPFGARPDDSPPIEVFLEVAGQIEPQAIVGCCFGTQTGLITQGLVIRANDDSRWCLNVGHIFNKMLSTAADNMVTFCPPSAPPNPATPDILPDCAFCLQDQCQKLCLVIPKDKRISIATGETDIITLNPWGGNTDTFDFGAYKVLDLPTIGLNALSVSSVLKDTATLNALQSANQYAYDEVAGKDTGLIDVAQLVCSVNFVKALGAYRKNGLFIFKKGIGSGWSFAQVKICHENGIFATPLGKEPTMGDCGAIWFLIDPIKRLAVPLGYHAASMSLADGSKFVYLVPYITIITEVEKRDDFSSSQFLHLESYDW
ncbi:hypothetical protein TWF694_011448 [Orbilia ellipsospora]